MAVLLKTSTVDVFARNFSPMCESEYNQNWCIRSLLLVFIQGVAEKLPTF